MDEVYLKKPVLNRVTEIIKGCLKSIIRPSKGDVIPMF